MKGPFLSALGLLGSCLMMGGAPGEKRWEAALSSGVRGAPTLATNGDILVGTDSGKVVAFTSTGSVRWSFSTPVTVFGTPAVGADGTIYFGAEGLYALNPDGSQRWRFNGTVADPIGYTQSPMIGWDGAIYVTRLAASHETQRLYAINPDGSLRWVIPGNYNATPCMNTDGSIIVPKGFGGLALVNPDGMQRWSRGVLNILYSPPALGTDGTIFVGGSGGPVRPGMVAAVSPNGDAFWRYEGGAEMTGSPILGPNGVVYFGFSDGHIIALNTDGLLKWEYWVAGARVPGRMSTTPALAADGILYAGGHHWMHALDTNGHLVWRYDGGVGPVGSPLIGADGSIYFGAGADRIVAIEGTGAPLAASQWPMFGGDAQHRSNVAPPLTAPAAPTNVIATLDAYTDKVKIDWATTPRAAYYDIWRAPDPDTSGATLIATGVTGRTWYEDRRTTPGQTNYYFVVARNLAGTSAPGGPVPGSRRIAQPGEVIWIFRGAGPIATSPTVGHDGSVYFSSTDGNVYALDDEGLLRWKFPFGSQGVGGLLVAPDGTIYFSAGRTNSPGAAVFSLSPSGALRWMTPVSGVGGVAIAQDGTVYATSGALVALDANGTVRWTLENGHTFASTPAVGADGTIYASTYDGWLHAVRPDGTLHWAASTGDISLSSPVIDDRGVLFFGGINMYAMNADGTRLWTFLAPSGGSFAACVDQAGTIYGGSAGSAEVYAFNPDGSLRWRVPFGSHTEGSMALDAAGTLYVVHGGVNLSALSSTGAELWDFAGDGNIVGGPMLGPSNTVYMPTAVGSVYAIRASAPPMDSPWPQTFHDSLRTSRSTVLPPAPTAPTNLTATLRTRVTDVRLTWSSMLGASSYELFRATNGDIASAVVLGEFAGQLSYDDQGAVAEQTNTYWVRAKNASGTSPFSAPALGIRRQAVPGDLLFTWNLEGAIRGSPAIGNDGTIYVSAGRVAALRPDGTIRWQSAPYPRGLSSPALAADGTIYVGTRSSEVQFPAPSSVLALNPDGTRRWEFPTSDAVDSTPAIGVDGTIYFGSAVDGKLWAISPAGELLWTYNSNSQIDASPAIGGDGTIYALVRDGSLHAIEPSGMCRWKVSVGGIPLGDAPMPSPAIGANGVIYVASGGLTAVNMDGTIRWRGATSALYASPIIDANNNIIAGAGDGIVFATHPSGTNLWRLSDGSFHYGAAAASANGINYIATRSGNLLAMSATGSNVWQFSLGSPARSSPAIAPDGTLYVGTDDRRLRSFFGAAGLATSAWPMFQRDLGHRGQSTNAVVRPTPVTSTAASDGTFADRVRVTWTSVDGAWYYEVWRTSTTNLADVVQLAASLTTVTSLDDTNVVEGASYFYFVRAGNVVGLGDFGLPDVGSRRVLQPGEVVGVFRSRNAFAGAAAMHTNGALFISGNDGRLYALNPDLTEKWHYEISSSGGFSTPVVAPDGSVLASGSDGAFRCFNPDGAIRWQTRPVGTGMGSPPAMAADGTVYFATLLRELHAYNSAGTQAWVLSTTGLVTTAAAVGTDGAIYFGTDDRKFNAVGNDGSWLWRFAVPGALRSHPAVGPDGTIYFGCDDNCLYALSPEGTKKWAYTMGGPVRSPPTIGEDCTIYVGANDRNLYAISPDGLRRWQYAADGAISTAATIASDGTIFFGTAAGSIYALRGDGSLVWRSAGVGDVTGGSLLLPDGRLVFGTATTGPLFAVRTAQTAATLHWTTAQGNPQRNGCASNWIRLPAPGSIYSGESFNILADWTVPGRNVARADLYSGTNLVATLTNTLGPFAVTNAAPGTNRLFVLVLDDAGCTYRSDSLSLVVSSLTLRGTLQGPDRWQLDLIPLPNHLYTLVTTTNLVEWLPSSLQSSNIGGRLTWTFQDTFPEQLLRAFRVMATPIP